MVVRLPKSNRVNVPPASLASVAYNDSPVPLSIGGARQEHAGLFERLESLPQQRMRAACFEEHMDAAFHLHQWRSSSAKTTGLNTRNSYVRFLLGWMFDANSPEGAVMKGWVLSRFGLPPIYHRAPLEGSDTEAYFQFEKDCAKGLGTTNDILHQLDLLYEFTQWELAERHATAKHLTLYRGIYDFDEHSVETDLGGRNYRIWLNNLNSFTTDFERAWEFGDRVLEVRVPLPKVFFDGAFLHSNLLQGEEEVLVLGGRYEVRVCLY
jgi:NAD+--dinitrogen-reductase ADP-D-ribosyltransferase